MFQSKFGKKFVVLALVVALGLVVVQPRRSEAAVGAIVALGGGAASLLVVGGVMTVGGFGFLWAACHGPQYEDCTDGLGGLGMISILLGLLLLDEQNREIAFTALEAPQEQKLGVSVAQAQAYNSELPEINVIRETIQADVAARIDRGEEITNQQVKDQWQSYRELISSDAYFVLEKVSSQVFAKP